ncbi:LOW QUALITY PROTEIN: probable inactive receptor kinase At4g23740 [Zea mays]|uniref:LOW QUALITY PROTEIN: probable inactive receptor kinase At4g23740 n=1 Tax=Zea mays TaxID=4577 RepID=UPI0009A9EF5F|nr:LOW QUALITY PROTEIN: probable inactive receptor kinase At4g23740 [Zea mays]|eukprot:XP_008664196.2 LOW QUALITY PROTEIN: probable inactive receptor kinase At4g23740 [Zea mays]
MVDRLPRAHHLLGLQEHGGGAALCFLFLVAVVASAEGHKMGRKKSEALSVRQELTAAVLQVAPEEVVSIFYNKCCAKCLQDLLAADPVTSLWRLGSSAHLKHRRGIITETAPASPSNRPEQVRTPPRVTHHISVGGEQVVDHVGSLPREQQIESRRRIARWRRRLVSSTSIHATGSMATHGNIRSSNIPLSRNVDGRVSDHGLARLVGVVGYRAPEVVTDPRRTSQKADLYGFGVLLLELLTGKAPTHAVLQHDEGVDLPRWARSVVRGEWTSEVFDAELLSHLGAEEEMVEVLRLAMDCTEPTTNQRPAMPEVVQWRASRGSAARRRRRPRGPPGVRPWTRQTTGRS